MNRFRIFAVGASLGVALAAAPAPATEPCVPQGVCTGRISYPWVTPGMAERLNSATAEGTFGWSIDSGPVAEAWTGKTFKLTTTNPAADVDVYFYIPDEQRWDVRGVNEGNEAGTIPAGTKKAFVMLSYLTPAAGIPDPVPFTFTVT